MIPNQHIQDSIDVIESNAQVSIHHANAILFHEGDKYDKHKANEIKSRNEDTLRMIAALRVLLKDRA